MRRIRYQVAMSLDGYIAGPKGEHDWILMDPEIDFREFFRSSIRYLWGVGRSNRWLSPETLRCSPR